MLSLFGSSLYLESCSPRLGLHTPLMTCSSFSGLDCTLLLIAYGMLNTRRAWLAGLTALCLRWHVDSCVELWMPLEKEGVVGSEEIVFLSYGSSSVVNSFQHPQGQL